MPPILPPLPNDRAVFAVASFVVYRDRALDLKLLELHFRLAPAYLSALNDVRAIAAENLRALTLLLDRLYLEHLRRLGALDLL
ncbi:hypothetical protein [Pseudomonas sp. No.117]